MASSLLSSVVCFLILALCCARGSSASGTFGFDIHHRYSDAVKTVLGIDGLPEKDTLDYYKSLVHRDNLLRGRRLAGDVNSSLLTFVGGNITLQFPQLGYLHYTMVKVGTPGVGFLVALDTGSDYFWLPCECTQCARNATIGGQALNFNIYTLNASSTSAFVSCSSSMCGPHEQCLKDQNVCAYQASYLSPNTSSTGVLVEDVLHLLPNDSPTGSPFVDATITLGCGIVQKGAFLTIGAPNGLFGLGMDNISVPSILASQGLTANSFSMCFGPDTTGRIVFGDKGSSQQSETPFNIDESYPMYNVSVQNVVVGATTAVVGFTALFDSGSSFTTLQGDAYTTITDAFNSQVKEPRRQNVTGMPFEYCYDIRRTQNGFEPSAPSMTLIMKGGGMINLTNPLLLFELTNGRYVYCLGIRRSEDYSIIGQNFMTGYRFVFDREKMVLGWTESDCYDAEYSGTGSMTPPPSGSPTVTTPSPPAGRNSGAESPIPPQVPEATPGNSTNSSPTTTTRPRFPVSTGDAARLNSVTGKLMMLFLSVFSYCLLILS